MRVWRRAPGRGMVSIRSEVGDRLVMGHPPKGLPCPVLGWAQGP